MQFWLLAIVITLSCCSCAQTRHVPETPIAPDISKAIDETQTEFREKLLYVKGAETPFSGDTIRYYSSRQPESFCHWLNGNLHGISTDWHENGIIKEQCDWSYGEPSGAFSQWDEQGRLIRYGNWTTGEWQTFDTSPPHIEIMPSKANISK